MISVYHAAEVEDTDKEVVEPIYIEDEVVSCTSGMTNIYRSSCVSQTPGSDDEQMAQSVCVDNGVTSYTSGMKNIYYSPNLSKDDPKEDPIETAPIEVNDEITPCSSGMKNVYRSPEIYSGDECLQDSPCEEKPPLTNEDITSCIEQKCPRMEDMWNIYRMSDAPPDWDQDDPSQPDYIKNKDQAEKFRPIYINGEEILDDTHESGPLNLVGGDNIILTTEGNSVTISSTGGSGDCDHPDITITEEASTEELDDEVYEVVRKLITDKQNSHNIIASIVHVPTKQYVDKQFSISARDIVVTEKTEQDNTDLVYVIKQLAAKGNTITPVYEQVYTKKAIDSNIVNIVKDVITNGSVDEVLAPLVNTIESISLPGAMLAPDKNKTVIIPYATSKKDLNGLSIHTAGVVVSSDEVNKIRFVDGVGEINAVSTDKLVQGNMILFLSAEEN